MTDATDYDPVECPVSDCTYRDAIHSVAAHISGTKDDSHSWDQLGYSRARDFVMAEKRHQRGQGETVRTSVEMSANETDRSDDHTEPEEFDFKLGFERDALVLLKFASENNLSPLDDLEADQLTDLYSLLADLKNSAENAREEVRDALLDELRENGTFSSDLGSVNRYTYTNRQLEDETAIRGALDSAGVDPNSVRSFDKRKLRNAVEENDLDEDAVFDVEELPRIQAVGANEEHRRQKFDGLDPEIRSLTDDSL